MQAATPFMAKKYIINTYARYPVTLVRGEGAFVWDIQGKKYLDFMTGIACTPLGHCHPTVTKAIVEQIQTLMHTSNLYYSPPSVALAKWLVEQGGLDKIFFCNSGAEANEAAIKLARKYQQMLGMTEKYVILSTHHSFHGRTLGALAATAKPKIQEGFGPMPAGFRYESWDDSNSFCNAIDASVAAVILEPVQGEGGIRVAPIGLLQAVRRACNEMGVLLIFDEIQCGIGRCGKLFAYQHFAVKPDIITLAKGIANGLPLGVVCASEAVANALSPGDHGTTFGGNPVTCSAALATLNTLLEEDYLPRIKQLGDYLLAGLHELQSQYSHVIKSVRGLGLMLGMELATGAQQILQHCRDAGLLVNITADNVLRMLPPYIITKADIDFAVAIIAAAIDAVNQSPACHAE